MFLSIDLFLLPVDGTNGIIKKKKLVNPETSVAGYVRSSDPCASLSMSGGLVVLGPVIRKIMVKHDYIVFTSVASSSYVYIQTYMLCHSARHTNMPPLVHQVGLLM